MTWPTMTTSDAVYAQRDTTRPRCYEIPSLRLALHFARKAEEADAKPAPNSR